MYKCHRPKKCWDKDNVQAFALCSPINVPNLLKSSFNVVDSFLQLKMLWVQSRKWKLLNATVILNAVMN